MATSEETVLKIQVKINEILHELNRLEGWTESEIADYQLGKDVDALKNHLDNASGRASTVLTDIRRIKRQKSVTFYRDDGTVFATIRDFEAAVLLRRDSHYRFSVGTDPTIYTKQSWEGRLAIEQEFGEIVRVQPV